MARGGRRSGTPGRSYANRVDLNAAAPHRLPITAAPGQTYGEAGAQQASQSAVPMASGNLGVPSPDGPPAPSFDDLLGQAQAYQPPNVVPLNAPTQNPGEHLLTPPAAPPPGQSDVLLQGVALLNSLGGNATPAVKALRAAVNGAQANAAAP